MAYLDVRLLGGFEIRFDTGQKVTLPTRKAEAILAYLAFAPDKARTRDQLTGLLWSDRAEAQAKNSLRQALTSLRRGLHENGSTVLMTKGENVALEPGAVAVDVVEFEKLAAIGSNGNLARAESLYQGPLLDGLNVRDPAFNEWLGQERARLHELAVSAVDRILAGLLRAGDHQAAIATAQRLLALDPLRESTYRTLMRLYAEQNQRGLAALQFERCRYILAQELDVEPAPATRRLYEEIVGATEAEPVPRRRAPLPLPAIPSVAVLPFANLSGDPDQGYLSNGLTEDVITELARFSELFVIGSESSLALKDSTIGPAQAARDLGVEYVVEGSVRKAGEILRVTVQLIDPATGHRLWAERYDRPFAEVFAIQDEIVGNIAGTLSVNIEQARAARTRGRPPESLDAYDYCLRAKEAALVSTAEAHAEASDVFRKALDIDPSYAPAWAGLAMMHNTFPCFLPGADLRESLDHARHCAEKALALDRTLPRTYSALAWAQLRSGEFDLAQRNINQASALSPNDSEMLATRAIALAIFGDFRGAVEVAEKGLRMNPFSPDCYLFALSMAAFFTGRYEDELAYTAEFTAPFAENLAWRAASHAFLGNEEAARREAEAFVREYSEIWKGDPAAGPADYTRWILRDANYFARDEDRKRLAEGLRLAGLPA